MGWPYRGLLRSPKELTDHSQPFLLPALCIALVRSQEMRAPIGSSIVVNHLIRLMMVDVHFHRIGIGSQLLAYAESRLFADMALRSFDLRPLKAISR